MLPHLIPELRYDERHYVYAMLCQDGGGPGYVKFGRSKRIGDRLTALRTGCPIPAKYFAICCVGTESWQAKKIERAFHTLFAERRITGEWFRFDFSSVDDKRDFNVGSFRVFLEFLGPGHTWTKISVAALDEDARRRRQWFMNSKHRKKIESRERYRVRQRQAWRELDTFR